MRRRLPAGVHREILGVIGVLFILLEIQLCQKLTGFHHSIITVLQNSFRPVHLRVNTKTQVIEAQKPQTLTRD